MANRLERSRGWVLKQALIDWVALEDERRRLTLEAHADVDAGNIVERGDVERWAASLGTDAPLPSPTK